MKLRALAILVIITIFIGSLAGCEAFNGLQNSDGNQDIVCNHIDADDNALCDTCGEPYTDGDDLPDTTDECKHSETKTVKENNTEPSCIEEGYYENVTYCVDCDEEISRDRIDTDPLGHRYHNGECIACGALDPYYVPPHAHNYISDVIPPTCTESGYTTYTCAGCGDSYVAKEVEATGHQYVDGICGCGERDPEYIHPHEHEYRAEITAPTCTESGYTTYTCVGCGDRYIGDEEFAPLGHNGYEHDFKCDACDSIVAPDADATLTIEQAIILGSLYNRNSFTANKYYVSGEIKVVENLTYGNMYLTDGVNDIYIYGFYSGDGKIRYDAMDLKPVEGDTVTVYGVIGYYSAPQIKNAWMTEHTLAEHKHVYEITDGVYPTCTVDGYYVYKCDCGDTYREIRPAFGHTPKNVIKVIDPTCVTSGYTVYKCQRCNNQYEDDVTYFIDHDFVDSVCTACGGVDPEVWSKLGDSYLRSGNYIYFGEFAQTIKDKYVEISDVHDDRGYYLGSDGCYYVEMTLTHSLSGYHFTNGVAVKEGDVCYFKVEPIRWRILTEEEGSALILCDVAVFNEQFHNSGEEGNGYEYSDIRAWLNGYLYNTLFNELQRRLINETELPDVATAGAERIADHIFLLSEADVLNSDYGFLTNGNYGATVDSNRQIMSSDYYRALGGPIEFMDSNYYGVVDWLLRTPSFRSYQVKTVASQSHISAANVYNYYAVIPAMWITLQ